MSQENKAIVRQFVEEVWNKGNLSVVDQLISANYSHNDNATPGNAGFAKTQCSSLL